MVRFIRVLLRRDRPRNWNAWTLSVGAIVLLGGGSWVVPAPRLAAELVAIAMIVAALGSRHSRFPSQFATEDRIVGGVILLLLAHIAPLPPAFWSALPGRTTAVSIDLALWGKLPWHSFSLDPASTFRCLIALLPPFATYLAVRTAPVERTTAILASAPLVLAAAAGMALGQMLLRDEPLLRPYPLADYPLPVGFFMNHNHQATLLVCLLPLLALWRINALSIRPVHGNETRDGAILLAAAVIVTLLTLATGSRSGAVLLPVSVVLTGIMWLRRTESATNKLAVQITALVLGLAVTVLALLATGADLLEAPFLRGALGDDLRWRYWVDGAAAVSATWPWGAGMGTFVEVFASYEPLSSVSRHYLNHAHNDYLEIAIEAGIPGILLVAAALWRSVETAFFLLRPVLPPPARAQLGAALLVILLAALHSAVDYPLRTYAISTLVALCWGLQANLAVAPTIASQPRVHNEVS